MASGSSSHRNPSPPQGSLRRGKACVNCRRRKIKCDGARPICGQCQRNTSIMDECEYTDVGRSRTQILEENISHLEARIKELENPGDGPSSSVHLHDPYIGALRVESPGLSSSLAQTAQATATGSSASNPVPGSPGSGVPSSSDTYTGVEIDPDEPPSIVIQTLLHTFFHQSSEFGFFLDIPRFRNSALLPLPFGHHSRPAPALLCAVYLWGIHLSESSPYASQEPVYLTRALQQAANGLSGDHPHRILHGIQAEILLCIYFFRNGRLLEGKYHASAAVSLAISSGFNRIRTSQPGSGYTQSMLPPPQDSVEEGERINAFWTVLTVNNCWAVALGSPSNISYTNVQIDTPWPLDIQQYDPAMSPPTTLGDLTVQKFLDGDEDNATSVITLYAKASILLERAAGLAAQLYPNMPTHEATSFSQQFIILDSLIERFKESLPPLEQIRFNMRHAIRQMVIIHTITHAATIQLHNVFAPLSTTSRQKCLVAANDIVAITNNVTLRDYTHINPVASSLWTAACQVLIDEISRIRAMRLELPRNAPLPAGNGEENLKAALERGFAAMATFSLDCFLMSYQLNKIQETYANILP